MRASGQSGLLRVGYQVACELGAWELSNEGTPGAYAFRATIERRHDYWTQQRPLDLAVGVGGTEWAWRDVAVSFVGEGDRQEVVVAISGRPVVSERIVNVQPRGTT